MDLIISAFHFFLIWFQNYMIYLKKSLPEKKLMPEFFYTIIAKNKNHG